MNEAFNTVVELQWFIVMVLFLLNAITFIAIRNKLNLNFELKTKLSSKPIKVAIKNLKVKTNKVQKKYDKGKISFDELKRRLIVLDEQLQAIYYGIIPPTFRFDDSEKLKDNIRLCHDKQLKWIISDKAVSSIDWTIDGSKEKGNKFVKDYKCLMLRAFNNEFETIRRVMKHSSLEAQINKLNSLDEKLMKLGEVSGMYITHSYFNLKIEELNFWHKELVRKKTLKENTIKQREILKKEKNKFKEVDIDGIDDELKIKINELARARAFAEKILGNETARKEKELNKLENEIDKLKEKRDRALSQAQKTKVGYIYVISNLGSFGENVIKIGMTRRLEPIERVFELGDASVPFRFDVHTIAFVKNAPMIEKNLHKKFDDFRVNKNNNRKEFFNVNPHEVAKAMREMSIDSDWYFEIEAREYNETLLIRQAQKKSRESTINYLSALPEAI